MGRRLLASLPGRYAVALLGCLLAALAEQSLWPLLHIAPFMLFFLAIMVAGWWGGWGPAIASIALSVLLVDRLFLSTSLPSRTRAGDLLTLGLFALVATLISWLNVTLRRSNAERVELLEREHAARRQAEAERIRLHTLLRDAPACIALFRGPEHVFVLSNAQNGELVAGRDVVGRPLREVMPEAGRQELLRMLDEAYTTGRSISARELAVQLLQPWGSTRQAFLNLVCQPTYDAENRVEGVVTFAFDVTDLVLARKRAEHAEKGLQRLADSIPTIVWSAGADGRNDFYNRCWYEYTGIPEGSLDFELAIQATHPEDLATHAEQWRLCLERGEPFQGEFRLRRGSDRSYRWHLTRTVPWKDEHGHVARWFGTSIDIDESKRVEAALRESEARFRNMADHAPVMLGMTDEALRCTYFNRPWYAFTGLGEAGSLGHRWLEAVHAEDVLALKEQVLAALSRREPVRVDHRLRRGDGEYRWVSVSALPRFGGSGELLGYIGSGIDVTDRKRSEELLALLARAGAVLGSSLDETETLTAAAGLAVPVFADWCLVDLLQADGTFQRVRAVHAVSEDSEQARRDPRFSQMPEGHPQHPITQALSRGETLLIEHFTPGGLSLDERTGQHPCELEHSRPRSCIAVPLVARDSMLGVLSFFTSRSGRHYTPADKSFAEELARRVALSVDNARLYKRAQEAVRLRDEFLSVASHELKTPLTPLSLKLQMLARRAAQQPDSPFVREVRAHVEVGLGQVKRLGTLIGDLLDVSRISAGRMVLTPHPLDFAALLREVASRHEAQAARTGTSLLVEAPPSLPGSWDATRLEQVVVNLVDNALKYGAGKPVSLRLVADPDNVVLTVEDRGIGIAPRDQTRIFERFARAVSERHYGGLGLGLYITKSLVEAMGGAIRVQSEPGKGAAFTMVLPRNAPLPRDPAT